MHVDTDLSYVLFDDSLVFLMIMHAIFTYCYAWLMTCCCCLWVLQYYQYDEHMTSYLFVYHVVVCLRLICWSTARYLPCCPVILLQMQIDRKSVV